jgi:FMN phosphatase YigB (HAD superfamily)
MKKLSNNKSTKPIVLFDIDYTLFNTAHLKQTNFEEFHLYNEVVDVLHKLVHQVTLGILSEGEIDWQKRKLSETNIHHLFEESHTHIVKKKFEVAETILKKYKKSDKVYLVDDKLTFLHQAKLILPSLKTIWIKRGVYAINQLPIEGFTPDLTIENLQELLPHITNA